MRRAAGESSSRSTRRTDSGYGRTTSSKEYGAPSPGRGYSCSPLLYNATIIVTLGGSGQAVAAFDQQTGALAGTRLCVRDRKVIAAFELGS
jgi:hypothetical protein